MRILNLYSGIGGNRKLWGAEHSITAVENNTHIAKIYKDLFPQDTVVIEDAHQYLLNHISEFDFIWSSPPCSSHSKMKQTLIYGDKSKIKYPDMRLYQEIIILKHFANKNTKWVVENVNPYYEPLIKPSAIINRHCFWSNFYVKSCSIFEQEKSLEKVESGTNKRYGFDITQYKVPFNKRVILRNLVNPEIGLFLLEQSVKGVKPLFNFNY